MVIFVVFIVFRGKGYSHFRFLKFDNIWKKNFLLKSNPFFQVQSIPNFHLTPSLPMIPPTYHRKTTMAHSNRETQVLDEVFRKELIEKLDELRKSNLLCDTTLRADGQEFAAHRSV